MTSDETNYPSLELPSNFNELYIEAIYTESSYAWRSILHIPAILFSDTVTRRYYSGYHYTDTQNLCVGYNINQNNISVVGAKFNNGTSDVPIKVSIYYR